MENRTDRLFREKLEGMEMPPSARAWEEIGRNFENRKNSGLWLRWSVAAAFLLTLGIGYVFERGLRNEMPVPAVGDAAGTAPLLTESPELGQPLDSSFPVDAVKDASGSAGGDLAVVVIPEKTAEVPLQPAQPDPLVSLQQQVPEDQQIADETVSRPEDAEWLQNQFQPENTAHIADAGALEQAGGFDEPLPIRIVYKRGRQPEPDRSGRRIVQRGVEKLTAFTDEIKLSEEARTKLRNTKEDVLALNISRLINRKTNENNELEE